MGKEGHLNQYRRDGKLTAKARKKWLKLTDKVEEKYRNSFWSQYFDGTWELLDNKEEYRISDFRVCPYCGYVDEQCGHCVVSLYLMSVGEIDEEDLEDSPCEFVIYKIESNKNKRYVFNLLRKIRKSLENGEI